MWFSRKRNSIANEAPFTIEVDGVSVLVTRKNVKYLRLRFLPSKNEVHASIPYGVDDDELKAFITSHTEWIKKRQVTLKEQAVVVNENEAYLLGRCYPLRCFSDSKASYAIMETGIDLYLPNSDAPEQRQALLLRIYKVELLSVLDELVTQWARTMEVAPKEWRVRQMRTRWGTCNPAHRRVWFSLELAKRERRLIEYIVVHELCHLYEAGHNARFYALMDRYLPDWRVRKRELNDTLPKC